MDPKEEAATGPADQNGATGLNENATASINTNETNTPKPNPWSNQPTETKVSFATIMAEQQSQAPDVQSSRVKFSQENEEERMMRLAIEASLRDDQGYTHEPRSVLKSSKSDGLKSAHVSFTAGEAEIITDRDEEMDEDMKMAIALSLQEANGHVHFEEEDKKPSAMDLDEKMPASEAEVCNVEQDMHISNEQDMHMSSNHTTTATVPTPTTAAAYASVPSNCEDESLKLAMALHNADLASAAASEEASLKLALALQKAEDDQYKTNISHSEYSHAALLKREEMCGEVVGVRTVGREEFERMKCQSGTVGKERRKAEEAGMGKLLRSSIPLEDDDEYNPYFNGDYNQDTTMDYKDNDIYEENDYQEEGIRMNPQSITPTTWKRLSKNTFVNSNNQIATKHDPLHKTANASKLQNGTLHSSSISDSAYNAFKRAEARQSGLKKGVAKQGHGRAENMNDKTRGGAMDGAVRLEIASAINVGLIERCGGVVKEGKEALVYHAQGRQFQQPSEIKQPTESKSDIVGSNGYDVAVKVFKRISEFKGRGAYVDGDPRFHKQKFKTNDQREQVVLWAEKEYRNLIRAERGGVNVPPPLRQKENVLFMRFLGEGGWPSPQLREVGIKRGSERWTVLYCQTVAAIRRLYHCSRLVHADLSEYNILLCPSWQISKDPILPENKRTEQDQSLVVVLIDFGQAVEREHPRANELLQRDISTVRDFFVKQGIQTLSVDDTYEFVLAPFHSSEEVNVPMEEDGNFWRHNVPGWDDEKVIEDLLGRLKAQKDSGTSARTVD